MEGLAVNFWQKKKVFVTGHTGFKGAWLCLWLSSLGAKVTGYSLEPPTNPNLFELAGIAELIDSRTGDVGDLGQLKVAIKRAKPQIVFHLAAQPIVRQSYKVPVETYETNVMGTVNLLESVRACDSVKAVVVVTTDKVYEETRNSKTGYREEGKLGGYDPYASSKACAELVAVAYRQSYSLPIATARAGNVIGGGDWAADRLVPDFIRAILAGKKIIIRYPKAVRPWQHVLEPLKGYLLLAEQLYKKGGRFTGAWNFGPEKKDAQNVEWLVKNLCNLWGQGIDYAITKGRHLHESDFLMLNSTKAKKALGWQPKWNIELALEKTVEWVRAYQVKADVLKICLAQIIDYEKR